MNPNRVDSVVDLIYGLLIAVSVGLILVVGTETGVAFGFGVLVSFIIHIAWKMARFDPEWMSSVQETVDATVSQTVDETVGDAVDESVEQAVGDTIEETVSETVEEAVDESVEQAVEDQLGEGTPAGGDTGDAADGETTDEDGNPGSS